MKMTRREKRAAEGEALLSTFNNMVAEDGSKKQFCIECGLPRAVEFAKIHPCAGCGEFGTQKVSPQFDELGERIPDEVIEQQRLENVERLRLARAAAKAARVAAAAAEAKKLAEETKPVLTVVTVEPASTQDSILLLW